MRTPSSCPGKPNLCWKFSASFLCFVLDLQFLTPGLQPSPLVTLLFIPIPHLCLLCCSVTMSSSLRPLGMAHGMQHARIPWPSLSPGAGSNSCPLSQWYLPAISSSVVPFSCPSPSQHQGLFQWVGSLHQVAKNWSFSFSIRPSNEYSGLISFRTDWFDSVSLFQNHTLKASILQHSAFFIVHLSHLYKTTEKL